MENKKRASSKLTNFYKLLSISSFIFLFYLQIEDLIKMRTIDIVSIILNTIITLIILDFTYFTIKTKDIFYNEDFLYIRSISEERKVRFEEIKKMGTVSDGRLTIDFIKFKNGRNVYFFPKCYFLFENKPTTEIVELGVLIKKHNLD